jgi:hypothetical protein
MRKKPISIDYTIGLCVVITAVAACLAPASAKTLAQCEADLYFANKACSKKACSVKGSAECRAKSSCFNYAGQRYDNCVRNASDRAR